MMKLERRNGVGIVQLPSIYGLYQQAAQTLVSELTEFAESLHRSEKSLAGVLLVQPQVARDTTREWLQQLQYQELLGDLAKRIDDCRWLLSLIRNSPIPWCYAAASDCFGSHWELALSCQQRYWFSPASQLGFPEIAAGVFPPGGVLESLSKRAGRTKEGWFSQYIFNADEALQEGLIEFCTVVDDWQSQALDLFLQLLRESPRTGVRETRRARFRESFDLTGDLRSRRAAFESLEFAWKHERELSPKPPSAWDYGWEVIKERSRIKNPGDLGRLIAHIAARHFLAPAYLAWLESSLIASVGQNLEITDALLIRALTIDLSGLTPPTEILARLLKSGQSLVCVARDGKVLANALNVMFSRLERALGTQQATSLWERGVSWRQGELDGVTSVVLRWDLDDRLTVVCSNFQLSFLRLEGNGPQATCGFLECLQSFDGESEPYQTALYIAAMTADGFIKANQFALGSASNSQQPPVPASVLIRSLALEELIHMAAHTDGDLGLVLESLNATGWRFAANEEAWDRFLRARVDAYPWHDALPHIMARAPDQRSWDLGTWKHAKAHARKVQSPSSTKWNPTAMSQHLAMFLGLVSLAISNNQEQSLAAAVDLLCDKALGFPSYFGAPAAFVRRRGYHRSAHYIEQHWPQLSVQRIWRLDDGAS